MITSKSGFFVLLSLAMVVLASFVSPNGKSKIKSPDGFVFIPMGSTTIDTATVSVQSFFMSKNEITNKQYRTFLNDLKVAGDLENFKKYYPDTTLWNIGKASYNQPMVDNYFCHPAYDNYPVVNISREGAEQYCKWLTKKLKAQFGESINDVRLPFREEWVFAARGGLNRTVYPWGGPYLRNYKGCFLCNFKVIGAEQVTYNNETGQHEVKSETSACYQCDGAFHTIIVGHYSPNDFGLYDMAGNVSEMVQQNNVAVGGSWNSTGYDVRVESTAKFDSPSPFVGFRPVMTYLAKQ
jgi:formylglycine-generating enzyme required for sulfatase activity